jgi:hypothetical protein
MRKVGTGCLTRRTKVSQSLSQVAARARGASSPFLHAFLSTMLKQFV